MKVGPWTARGMIAHIVAYPVAVAWMFGFTPLLFPIFDAEVTAASGMVSIAGVEMPAAAGVIVRKMIVVGAFVFAAAHLGVLAWARAPSEAAGRRRFVWFAGALLAAAALGGGASWAWLYLRAKAS